MYFIGFLICAVGIFITTFILSILIHAMRYKSFKEVSKFDDTLKDMGGTDHGSN